MDEALFFAILAYLVIGLIHGWGWQVGEEGKFKQAWLLVGIWPIIWIAAIIHPRWGWLQQRLLNVFGPKHKP